MEDNNPKWHIDKSVKLEFVIAMVVQLVAGVWFLSNQNTRVNQVEKSITLLQDTPQRLAVLDNKLDTMNTKVNDIQDKVWTLSKAGK